MTTPGQNRVGSDANMHRRVKHARYVLRETRRIARIIADARDVLNNDDYSAESARRRPVRPSIRHLPQGVHPRRTRHRRRGKARAKNFREKARKGLTE